MSILNGCCCASETDLVLCVLCEPVERRDPKLELSTLGELAEACTHRDQVRSRDRRSEVHRLDGEVVYPERR